MRNILLLLFFITLISCENDYKTSYVIIDGELINNNSSTVNISGNGFEKEIFVSLSFIVNNKLFWGQDRLEFALDEYKSY